MKFFNASANVSTRFRKKCSRGILKILVQHIVPLSALTQSAKICYAKYKMLKNILLEELLQSKIACASLPRISACTCLKMNVIVKYRNKMKKSCSAYAFHKRIIQKLVDNRYAQKCCSAYAFSQKARLNQIPNQHANISKSCNEARLSPLPAISQNVTKCCACHEKSHSNFTKYCACHEKCTLLFSTLFSLGIYSLLASILSRHLFSLGIYSL